MATSEDNEMQLDPARHRSDAAARIAAEVRLANKLGQTRLTKVTSLLHSFRTPGTPMKFNELKRELEVQGIELDSGWILDSRVPDIRRTGVLKLSLSGQAVSFPAIPDTDETIQMSVWSPGQAGAQEHPLPPYETPAPADVLWFNVDPPILPEPQPPALPSKKMTPDWRQRPRRAGDDRSANGVAREPPGGPINEAIEQRVSHVMDQLTDWCPELDEEMVRDLLRQDLQPKVETYGDENDGVRGVSAVAVIARERPSGDDDSDGVSEELVFQLVEMIVGDHWIVTCWHPTRIYTGTNEGHSEDPILREPFMSHVRYRWEQDLLREGSTPQQKTSGDLGVYLARSLVDTYGASHRMMERWVESWEVDFYRSLTSNDKADKLKEAAGEISNSLSMVGELRRRLTAFEHARWSTTDKSWFPGVSDRDLSRPREEEQSEQVKSLAKTLDSDKQKFELLAEEIRADMDLMMLQSAATQQESTERIQGYLAKVTGLVLVPTLVAGLFGANTQLPGGGSWVGFELMLLLMVVSAVGVYLVIRKLSQ